MDRYKLALFLISIGAIPLFYVSIWLGLAAVIAIYSLVARFANKDLDRQSPEKRNKLARGRCWLMAGMGRKRTRQLWVTWRA